MKSICITVLCGVLALAGTISAREVQPRTITTTGDSVVYVTPDEVIINFGVETFDANLDRAKAANDARSRTLLKAIAGLGVESKHIQTDTMSIEISYQPNGPAAGIAGYIAHKAFAVKLTNTKQFEQLVDAALKNGANQLMGFDFKTTQLRQYRDQARKMAINAAKQKAVALTAELDCGVGKPRTIAESGGGISPWFSRYYQRYANAQNSVQEMPPAGNDQGEDLPLGQIAVSAQVTVTFDLTDAPAPPKDR